MEEGEEFKPIWRGWCLGEEKFREELLTQMSERMGVEHYGPLAGGDDEDGGVDRRTSGDGRARLSEPSLYIAGESWAESNQYQELTPLLTPLRRLHKRFSPWKWRFGGSFAAHRLQEIRSKYPFKVEDWVEIASQIRWGESQATIGFTEVCARLGP
jgi:hypothetical protein